MLRQRTEDTDEEGETETKQDADAILAMDDSTWRRYYVGTMDLLYLMMASALADVSNGEERGLPDAISPRAQAVMRSNPTLAHILDDSEDNERFESAGEIQDFLNTLEAAEAIMREDLRGKPSPLINGVWDTETKTFATEPRLRLRVLDREEYNRPEGTRVIEVDLPILLTLTLVREDGVMRVLANGMTDD